MIGRAVVILLLYMFFIFVIAMCRVDHDDNNLFCYTYNIFVCVADVRRPAILADHDDNEGRFL